MKIVNAHMYKEVNHKKDLLGWDFILDLNEYMFMSLSVGCIVCSGPIVSLSDRDGWYLFFADRTATQYDLLLESYRAYCRLSVSLSVCPSVCDALHCGAQGRRRGLKVVHACSYRRALPIHFFRHFCCRICIVLHRSATTHSEKSNRRNFASEIAMGSVVTCPWLFQTRYFRRFGSAAILYVVCSTIGLLSNSYAYYVLLWSIWTGVELVSEWKKHNSVDAA